MANNRDSNLRLGDRAEYLGQFFLSALGVSVLVPRPEDIGIDFMCSLQSKVGRRLSFHSPFNVQMGAVTDGEQNKSFFYGGVTTPKDPSKRVHRIWEIEFLRSQHLPFFVGTIDKKIHRFRLYSASAVWFILHRYDRIGAIELCPDETHDPLRESRGVDVDAIEGMLPSYRVPLGAPVVDLVVSDLVTDLFTDACEALEYAVQMEHRNLVYRNLGVRYSLRLIDHKPNRADAGFNYSYVANPADPKDLLEWLKPVCIALAIFYRQKNEVGALKRVKEFLELLPLVEEDRKVLFACANI